MKIVNRLYKSKILGRLFHTLVYCLEKELTGCTSVLDIGCGPSSPLKNCKKIKYSVGVEPFELYFKQAQKNQIHSEVLNEKIENLNFAPKSFDAVIMIEVLEHFPESIGSDLLKKAEKWARKKIIISTPNGFIEQGKIDSNPRQEHLSGWEIEKMKSLNFHCYGLAGLKFFRKKGRDYIQGGDFYSSIKFRPKFFWFIFASISQMIVCFYPKKAYELFCVKEIK